MLGAAACRRRSQLRTVNDVGDNWAKTGALTPCQSFGQVLDFGLLGRSPRLCALTAPGGNPEVLYESGDVLRHVYFPTDSIVSLLYVLADGASAEISVVGNEGLIGIALFMGGETTPSRAIVQSAGHAYRLIGQLLKDEFHRNGPMQIAGAGAHPWQKAKTCTSQPQRA